MGKRIGLLTLPLNANFGGIIQAVSLSEALRRDGHEVVLLNRRRPVSRWQKLAMPVLAALPGQNIRGFRAMEQARQLQRGFIDKHFDDRSAVLRSPEQMRAALEAQNLDAVIVGSDQVWRLSYIHPEAVGDFFLGFVPDGVRRISYAASFGVGTWDYPERTAEVADLLRRFDAVSVRERSGVGICASTFGRMDARHVLDPTLLVTSDFHRAMAQSLPSGTAPVGSGRHNALFYMLDNPEIRHATLAALGPDYAETEILLSDSATISVPQWLRSFHEADFVVTDSFHGTIFAIVFRKPFLSIVNQARGTERFSSLLTMLGLEDRMIAQNVAEDLNARIAEPIDFDAVYQRLEVFRQGSASFLQEALS